MERTTSKHNTPIDDASDPFERQVESLAEEERPFVGEEEVNQDNVAVEHIDEAEEGFVPLAERGTRLLAALIDSAALITIIALAAASGPTAVLLSMLTYILLQGYLLSVEGQTIGKSLMKIKIVREEDGSNPGFYHAVFLRYFLPMLMSMVPLLGLIDILYIFREDRRCIHDHLADTIVIDVLEE